MGSLDALVWFTSSRQYGVDLLLQENSSFFDEPPIKELMCEVDTIPRSISVKSQATQDCRQPNNFYHQSAIFSPIEVDVSVHRARLYAAYGSPKRLPWSQGAFSFNSLYKKENNGGDLDGSVYLVASEETIAHELNRRLSRPQAHSCRSAMVDNRQVASLASGDASRLDSWRLEAVRKGLQKADLTWSVPMAIACISQDDEYYGGIATRVLPPQLPRSLFYDMVSERLLTVQEQWLAQHYAHPDTPGIEELALEFPFDADLVTMMSETALPLREQQELIGNSMHGVQISMWVLHCLASTSAYTDLD